jgi:hypothetical protein
MALQDDHAALENFHTELIFRKILLILLLLSHEQKFHVHHHHSADLFFYSNLYAVQVAKNKTEGIQERKEMKPGELRGKTYSDEILTALIVVIFFDSGRHRGSARQERYDQNPFAS